MRKLPIIISLLILTILQISHNTFIIEEKKLHRDESLSLIKIVYHPVELKIPHEKYNVVSDDQIQQFINNIVQRVVDNTKYIVNFIKQLLMDSLNKDKQNITQ